MKRSKREPSGISVGVRGGNFLIPQETTRTAEALKKDPGTPIEDPKLPKKEEK